ncbi:MAG: CPBP family intramembrane metalloprotease [Ruminococcaceae bacterium]|nr:CPBP family intramembrane metalloprotease [Oscillospiraceae bacterium]
MDEFQNYNPQQPGIFFQPPIQNVNPQGYAPPQQNTQEYPAYQPVGPTQPAYAPYPQQEYPQFGTQEYYMQQIQVNQMRSKEKRQILSAGFAIGITLVINLIVQVVCVSALASAGLATKLDTSFVFQHAGNIIIVDLLGLVIPFFIMSLIMKKRFETPIVPSEKVGFVKTCAWVSAGLLVCLGGNIITNFVISLFNNFGYELKQFDSLSPTNPFECVLLVLSTAVAPAICEEFAMRCASLGILRRHGKAFAVVAVSIVFGLIHGNVIQFVFAFIIGLILAYVTIMTDSIVPAMLIHGLNNGLSVVQDIVTYAAGKEVGETVLGILMLVILVCGVIGLIYLGVKHQLVQKKEQNEVQPYQIGFFTKLALLIPGLFIPFAILIVETAATVVPIK